MCFTPPCVMIGADALMRVSFGEEIGVFGSAHEAFASHPGVSEGWLRGVEGGEAVLAEPRGRFVGQGGVLARPRSVDEVSALLSHAHAQRVAVVPYGGGTGLVGGQVSPDLPAPLILSLQNLSEISQVLPQEHLLIAQAGAILQNVQEAALEAGRLFPLSIASRGSAQIGGLLSTNAGGVNVLRYGSARALCLGLEAVLPNGEVWHGLSRLHKDNTGYDLRDLLIGAEGTLGVITAATLRLAPLPAGEGTAFLTLRDPAAGLSLLSLARAELGECVSAFELISGVGLSFLQETLPQVRLPMAVVPPWGALISIGVPRGIDPGQALEDLFASALAAGLVSDGVIAQSQAQREMLWEMREQIPQANRRIGAIASHDISLPLGELAAFIPRAQEALLAEAPALRINCFGHLGDGNLHYNLFPPAGGLASSYAQQRAHLTGIVYDLVSEMGGSVSAEHGIGRLKTAELARYGDPVRLGALRAVKAALDPRGIMNPGVLFPMQEGGV